MITSYEDAYRDNLEFKEYVDKYCNQNKISVEEALTHKVVQEYLDYLLYRI